MYEQYVDDSFKTIKNDTWSTSTTRSVVRLMAWKEFDENDLDNIPYGYDLYLNPEYLILDHLSHIIDDYKVNRKDININK